MSVQKTIGPPINIILTRSNESSCIVILSSNQHNLGENLFFAPISLFSAEEIAHKLRYRLRLPQQRRLRAKLFHHRGKQSHEPRGRLYYCSEGATQRIGLGRSGEVLRFVAIRTEQNPRIAAIGQSHQLRLGCHTRPRTTIAVPTL